MNSFRDALYSGRSPSGPVMPAKQGARAPGVEGLTAVNVPRSESRTHNQRAEDRQLLSAGEARLFVGRRGYVVDLLNLSGGGAMIRTNVPLKLWKRVQLELAEGDCVECAVRWIRDDRIGLEFAHETQVGGDTVKRDAMLLETIARSFPELHQQPAGEAEADTDSEGPADSQRRAELRHPLVWSGDIHYDYETTRVRIRNISEHGAMVDCTRTIAEGSELLLDLGGAGQHFAFVSWSRGDQLGLRFQQPFDIACLARARPEVAPQSWTRPDFLNAQQGTDSPWAEPWERLSLPELKDTLEGYLKR